jgi:hypothetical protein
MITMILSIKPDFVSVSYNFQDKIGYFYSVKGFIVIFMDLNDIRENNLNK